MACCELAEPSAWRAFYLAAGTSVSVGCSLFGELNATWKTDAPILVFPGVPERLRSWTHTEDRRGETLPIHPVMSTSATG